MSYFGCKFVKFFAESPIRRGGTQNLPIFAQNYSILFSKKQNLNILLNTEQKYITYLYIYAIILKTTNMTLYFVLQATGASAFSWIFPVLMLAFFYFFFIAPQMKKQKEQSKFSSELKKGDEVVTASGIIGQINKIEDNAITLELDSKTFIRVVPSAISKEMTDQFKGKAK